MTKLQSMILEYLSDEPTFWQTAKSIGAACDTNQLTVASSAAKLGKHGLIEIEGRRAVTEYRITSSGLAALKGESK